VSLYKKNSPLAVERHIGNLHMDSGHIHDVYEFYYLKSGNVSYLANDKIYHLCAGDVVVIPPNTLHKTVSAKDSQRERILFYLDERFVSQLFDTARVLPTDISVFNLDFGGRIGQIFEEMLSEYSADCNALYLRALICELLVLLDRVSASAQNKATNGGRLPQIVSDTLSYIDSNYTKDISLSDAAKHFFVSAEYLSRVFKRYTGFTFSEYLTQYRIKEANKLLIQTDMKISEIAAACGFQSSNHFCKSYKKTVGTSALQYRKKTSLW